MKYIIVGAGPAGLSLAYILSKHNYDIVLIEKDIKLGGSWNSDWIEGKYFSENAPRVLFFSGYTKKLLNDIGINNKDLGNIYGNSGFEEKLKFFKFFYNYFSFQDYLIFFISLIKFNFFININKNLQYWLDNSNLTNNAKEAIRIFCIVLGDVPKKTNINDFFSIIKTNPFATLKQFKEPNKWHMLIEKKLIKNKVKIYKNCMVTEILTKNKKPIGISYINLKNNYVDEIKGDKIIIAAQSTGLFNILKNSSDIIKNNWINYNYIKEWAKKTYLNSFGFQLHFDKKIKFPNEWGWSSKSEWTIIILPVSNWLKIISKDKNIKTVWSCCIIDFNTKSKRLNKTANECTKDEVIDECLYQLYKLNKNIGKPYKVTFSRNLKKINNKWHSNNNGFTRGDYIFLSIKGKINNLYTVGSFSNVKINSVTYFECAVRASCKYLEMYEKNIIDIHNYKNKNYYIISIGLISLILLIIYNIYTYK